MTGHDVRHQVLELAASYIGLQEATGHNDGDPARLFADGEQVAWCAAMVRTLFEKAGSPMPGNRWLLRSCRYMHRQLRAAGAIVHRADLLPGDVVFFGSRLDSDREAPGVNGISHVELVEALDGAQLVTIGGNVGNAVKRQRRPRALVIAGGRWPK